MTLKKAESVMQTGEIILYQTPDNKTELEVIFEKETIWLTQAQIVILFSTSKANVSEHIKQIYKSKELEAEATVRKFRTVQIEGSRSVSRNIDYYNNPIEVKIFTKSHDRFLIIDDTTVYHIGASLKDLGKKWFAFSKIELNATELVKKIS
jgi:hypothetical protein